eukprot:gene593-1012_t
MSGRFLHFNVGSLRASGTLFGSSFRGSPFRHLLYRTDDTENTNDDQEEGDNNVRRVDVVKKTNSKRRQTLSDAHVLQSMSNASEAAHKLRFQITLSTTIAGFVPFVFTISMFWSQVYFYVDPWVVGHAGWYAGLIPVFGMIMLLGVLPNDAMMIRLLGFVLVFASWFSGGLCFGGLFYTWMWYPTWARENESDVGYNICEEEKYDAGCFILSIRFIICGLILLVTSFFNFAILKRYSYMKVYDRNQKKGFRYNDSAFRMPARLALEHLWYVLRWVCCAPLGLVYIFYAFGTFIAGQSGAPWYTNLEFVSDLFMGVMWIGSAVIFTDERRRKIWGYLSRINAKGEADSAAAVAAMLGGRDAALSLNLAKSRFRSINFADLSEEDFLQNSEKEGEKNTLFSKTKIIELGECDAFVSHSWSDCGVARFRELAIWAEDFKEEHGRFPELWIDKACIDQNDIGSDLLCLPVFAAGCEQLLILAGTTYCERLWCIIEVFVFLRMGGDLERMTVLPIEINDIEEAQKMFATVDASICKCHLESDRQKLLAVVEQGFGNFEEFNNILRHVFRKRVSRQTERESRQSSVGGRPLV